MPIIIKSEGSPSAFLPSEFASEQALESVLKESPDLLCDDDGPSEHNGPSIAYVASQVSLPQAGIVDLLFVTSDGLPVVVEVKLARNAQARREVVAQAIDYVSALTLLTVDELDERVAGALEAALYKLTIDSPVDFNVLWRNVGANLRAGKARLIMALDEATPSLERIFGFLARSSDLDVQLLTVQKYETKVGQVFVSRMRTSPTQVGSERTDGSKLAGTPNPIEEERVITVMAAGNPKKVGSAARERFALYKTGMTVGQFLAAGGSRADIRWDSSHGFIKIDNPAAEPGHPEQT